LLASVAAVPYLYGMHRLSVQNLAKRFGPLKVFSDISFELSTGESLAVSGRNGAGKSTLLMLLLGHYHPTRGQIAFSYDGQILDERRLRECTALVSPYLNLYDQLTAEENLVFFATVSGHTITGKETNALLSRVGLEGRGEDPVGGYSSGMKQRLKYAAALLKNPAFLFIDEPTSNLDDQGKRMARDIIEECRRTSVVIVATNEQEDLSLAGRQLRIGE
jgi:heme exporter protein A